MASSDIISVIYPPPCLPPALPPLPASHLPISPFAARSTHVCCPLWSLLSSLGLLSPHLQSLLLSCLLRFLC